MTFLEVNHEFPISKYFDKIDLFFIFYFEFRLSNWITEVTRALWVSMKNKQELF